MSKKPLIFAINDTIKSPKLNFKHHINKGIEAPDNSVDIVTSTLVCHHMNDDELVEFLDQAQRVAKHEVIINDVSTLFRTVF